MTLESSPPFKSPECTCPWGIGSAVTLYGISMGKEWVRMDTNPTCPDHKRTR